MSDKPTPYEVINVVNAAKWVERAIKEENIDILGKAFKDDYPKTSTALKKLCSTVDSLLISEGLRKPKKQGAEKAEQPPHGPKDCAACGWPKEGHNFRIRRFFSGVCESFQRKE